MAPFPGLQRGGPEPRTSFADPELRDGAVVPGPIGLPLPRSGNFADFYQLKDPRGKTWAVKCFTRQVAGLQERYARIAKHLRAARLPFTVRFTFLEKGIRARGDWYPVLKMQWVEGFTLNEFVRTHADRPDYLRALLGLWGGLSRRLRDARSPTPTCSTGTSCSCRPHPRTTEREAHRLRRHVVRRCRNASGSRPPAYQHPARVRDRIYSPDVDRFPPGHRHGLRATAVAGSASGTGLTTATISFREADLADPERSGLFRALWDLDDPTVTNLVGLLIDYAGRPVAKTPWLDEVLTGDRPATVASSTLGRAADRLGVSHRASRSAAPDDEVFIVPEQANAFEDMIDGEPAERARPTRSTPLAIPLILAGGGIVTLAVVVLDRGPRLAQFTAGRGPGDRSDE